MTSKFHISVRPPQLPVYDKPNEQEARFVTACESSTPPSLPLDTADAITKAKEELRTLQAIDRPSRPGDDVVVVPLGTCSAAPSKYRNGTFLSSQSISLRKLMTCHFSVFDIDTDTAVRERSPRLR